jgi:hypothetical protein
MGRPVENLARWAECKSHLEAACGGVTRFSSLVHGVERPEEIAAALSGSGAFKENRQVEAMIETSKPAVVPSGSESPRPKTQRPSSASSSQQGRNHKGVIAASSETDALSRLSSFVGRSKK